MKSQLSVLKLQARLAFAAASIGGLAGMASAALLVALDAVTAYREKHPWLLALLPLAGLAIGYAYQRWGGRAVRGTDLVIEEIHRPETAVPRRMALFVFFGTLVTHLFGGSAGREGTAVQMAASLGDNVARRLGFGDAENRRVLLMASLSAGFGSVFGVPIAGAIFGLEAPGHRPYRLDAIFPCLVASLVGHIVVHALRVAHTHYQVDYAPAFSLGGAGLALLAGLAFGALARAFIWITHAVNHAFVRFVKQPPLRPLIGGAAIALAAWALGTTRPLGLGIPVIVEAFNRVAPISDFALKLVFTALTIGSGFKGGEVTPLFFMGATGGSALARLLPLPGPLLAAMGFVAVFAGAAGVPLTCAVMASELFGPAVAPYAIFACLASWLVAGPVGLYRTRARLPWPRFKAQS